MNLSLPRLPRSEFLPMLLLAMAVHALVIGLIALLPSPAPTSIPVRALQFTLGGVPRVQAVVAPASQDPLPAPQATSMHWNARPYITPPLVPAPLKPMVPAQKPIAKAPSELAPPVPETPLHYVREVGAAPTVPVQPSVDASTSAAAIEAIRARYEQQISAWVQRHKYYPPAAGGREGRVVVRVRFDRRGYVRYYAVEQSSGVRALDATALDMIRRANPMPAVPENYPDGAMVEFLIPINFAVPR